MSDTALQPTLNYGIKGNKPTYRNKSRYDIKPQKERADIPKQDAMKMLIQFLDEQDEAINSRDRYIEQLEKLLKIDTKCR